MTEIPDNVSNEWIARHLVEFREETRVELRTLRSDIDKLIAIIRQMRDELRRLDRLDERARS